RIVDMGGTLVCQTDEIRQIVENHLDTRPEKIVLLPPHVPDPINQAPRSLKEVEEPHRLVYTGKFFKDWNIDSILSGIKSANLNGAAVTVDVAGDQFRHDEDDPFFVENV